MAPNRSFDPSPRQRARFPAIGSLLLCGLGSLAPLGHGVAAGERPDVGGEKLAAPASDLASDPARALVRAFPDAVIVPFHESLAAATARLAEAGGAFEADADETSLRALRAAWLETAATWAAGQAFSFGPVHSLGHGAALYSPVDAGGVAWLLENVVVTGAEDPEHAMASASVQGLGAMSHLLHDGPDGGRAAEGFDAAERAYLRRLTGDARAVAEDLLGVWRDGHEGRAPFAERLATAGEPDHVAYPTAEAGAEEIVRALANRLTVVVDEELPVIAEAAAAPTGSDGAIALALLAGTVEGVRAAGGETSGLGRWLASLDPALAPRLRRSLGDAADAAAALGDPDADARLAAVERVGAALEDVRELLGTHALPRAPSDAGAVTASNRTSSAFEEAPPNLDPREIEDHDLGDEAFEESFVQTAGHATSGLGPTFNNTSCGGCHVRNGRGMPVAGQLLVRVSDRAPGGAAAAAEESDNLAYDGAPPVAGIGNQIQDFSVGGAMPEAHVDIRWVESEGRYADGTAYRLRAPELEITLAATGEPLPDGTRVSPRVPPHVYGLGLLEAIPEADILALADPDDADGDGVSGRPNRVWDVRAERVVLGRFGLKANSPNLLQQSAEAYLNDMGIHSPLFPAEDGSTEIDAETLRVAAAYAQTLAAPARAAPDDPLVRAGEALFSKTGCDGCHVRASPPDRTPTRRSSTGASSRTPTCCCTTWARGSPTGATTSRRTGASGARRRCGASASCRPCCPTPATCTTGARAPWPRRSCGTAARPRPRSSPSSGCRPTSAARCSGSCARSEGIGRINGPCRCSRRVRALATLHDRSRCGEVHRAQAVTVFSSGAVGEGSRKG